MPPRLGLVAEFANEALVIGGAVTGVRGAKARKVPRGPHAARYVQVVEVHLGMRARDDDGLGLEPGDAPTDLLVGGDGVGDLLALVIGDAGDDERRVRNGKRRWT